VERSGGNGQAVERPGGGESGIPHPTRPNQAFVGRPAADFPTPDTGGQEVGRPACKTFGDLSGVTERVGDYALVEPQRKFKRLWPDRTASDHWRHEDYATSL
jgi:hypothetical protein